MWITEPFSASKQSSMNKHQKIKGIPLYHSQAKFLRYTSWQCIASPCHLVCVIKCWHLNSLQKNFSLHCHWNRPRHVVSYLNWAHHFEVGQTLSSQKNPNIVTFFFWHPILSFQDVPSSIYSCLFLCKKGFPTRAKEVSGPGNIFFDRFVSTKSVLSD